MEEKKTAAKAEKTEATVKAEATPTSEAKKSKGGITGFLFGIGGVVLAIIVLCICCCICFAALTTTDSFKEEYCKTLLEDNGNFDNDVLDICDDYVQDSIDEALEDYNGLFDDYDWDFDYEY